MNILNKEQIRKYFSFSIAFIFLLGTLLHFTYDWLSENKFVAIFSSINESTWEHLKLIYFPMLLSTIIGFFHFRKMIPNFLCSKVIGILIAIGFTVVFFYTYAGILGKNIPAIDIASFFISTSLGEFVAYTLIVNKYKCSNKAYLVILILIFLSFVIFTFHTPKIGLFKDPVTGIYGITE